MKELSYPFDAEGIIKKKKRIKRQLLEEATGDFLDKKIAILGGQTTQTIRQVMELFLLDHGIRPEFWESEYDQWYEDGCFDNPGLKAFAPDVIYICTCGRNIRLFPETGDDATAVEEKADAVMARFRGVWEHVEKEYRCPVIQNNFELPYFRLMGNRDGYDNRGRVHFVRELNERFAAYAREHKSFYLCDVDYISSCYGLDAWSDPYYWHMYKYAVAVPAIPYLSFNVANIIKSVFGKNKKALNLDLDNTLWGGIVGDDGPENIEIGQENPVGQTFAEFQEYLKAQQQIGVLLTVNSKNEEAAAKSGLARPDGVLAEKDFISFKANWDPKNKNLGETAAELSLLPESFVFVDDNPAERAIIEQTFAGTAVPDIDKPEAYLRVIDRSGFFEVTELSEDDLTRNAMYRANADRVKSEASFADYAEYLTSLAMEADIEGFIPMFYSRIAQLSNKSNQFNLTTKRYTAEEIAQAAEDSSRITLYGRLRDRFGDNGVVSVVIGHISDEAPEVLDIELWLMSCRVLKRNMELAMLDTLVLKAKEKGIRILRGYYYPTAKNAMVKNLYGDFGFKKISEDEKGNTIWEFEIPGDYEPKQNVITVRS